MKLSYYEVTISCTFFISNTDGCRLNKIEMLAVLFLLLEILKNSHDYTIYVYYNIYVCKSHVFFDLQFINTNFSKKKNNKQHIVNRSG